MLERGETCSVLKIREDAVLRPLLDGKIGSMPQNAEVIYIGDVEQEASPNISLLPETLQLIRRARE